MTKLGLSRLKLPQDVDAPTELPGGMTGLGRDIAFSSPMPWLLAMALSVAIWVVLGWSVWRFVHG
jgi:hypothetical protein